jgi:membrane associated rhomboid family serine protease
MRTGPRVLCTGMYVRGKIIGYDYDSETYDLIYCDGPYMGDEIPDGQKYFEAPPEHPRVQIFLRKVPTANVIVDLYDNYGSSLPLFLVGISLLQILRFVSFCFFGDPEDAPTATSPIAGPEWTWYRTTSNFPECQDLRGEWWRLLSHQTVHAGYEHLAFNVLMQIIFGMPVNLVHGNLRFGLIYELGVIGGAIAFATMGGGGGALVGCSGGVYCIIGMMVAEIIINWDVSSKGLMNHWTRLVIIAIVLIVDFYLYFFERSESTSYSAHIGGFAVGMLIGILTLDNIEVSWFEKWLLMPITQVLGTKRSGFIFFSSSF